MRKGPDRGCDYITSSHDNICVCGVRTTSAPTQTPEDCADGMDNDGDLLVDCLDDDCAYDLACHDEFGEACADGVDNDGDDDVDCEDTACANYGTCDGSCIFKARYQVFEDSGDESGDPGRYNRGRAQANCAASSCLDQWTGGAGECRIVDTCGWTIDDGEESTWTSYGFADDGSPAEWLAYDLGYFLGDDALDEVQTLTHICVRWGRDSKARRALGAERVRVDVSGGLVVGAVVDVAARSNHEEENLGQIRFRAKITADHGDGTYDIEYTAPSEYGVPACGFGEPLEDDGAEPGDDWNEWDKEWTWDCPTEGIPRHMLRLSLEDEANWIVGDTYYDDTSAGFVPGDAPYAAVPDALGSCFALDAPVATQHVRLAFVKSPGFANAGLPVRVADVRFKGACRTAAPTATAAPTRAGCVPVGDLDLVVPIDSSNSVDKFHEWPNMVHGANAFVADCVQINQ